MGNLYGTPSEMQTFTNDDDNSSKDDQKEQKLEKSANDLPSETSVPTEEANKSVTQEIKQTPKPQVITIPGLTQENRTPIQVITFPSMTQQSKPPSHPDVIIKSKAPIRLSSIPLTSVPALKIIQLDNQNSNRTAGTQPIHTATQLNQYYKNLACADHSESFSAEGVEQYNTSATAQNKHLAGDGSVGQTLLPKIGSPPQERPFMRVVDKKATLDAIEEIPESQQLVFMRTSSSTTNKMVIASGGDKDVSNDDKVASNDDKGASNDVEDASSAEALSYIVHDRSAVVDAINKTIEEQKFLLVSPVENSYSSGDDCMKLANDNKNVTIGEKILEIEFL